MSVVGARPQFIKLAPISKAMAEREANHKIIDTGQHYDVEMSRTHFASLQIPEPDFALNVGSGSHASQTGSALIAIEKALLEIKPDWVLVYGDTNSTLAAALAAVKLDIRVAHLEAGLRSFNREMPEEHNRVLADHAADLLLAPTRTAVANLAAEGLSARTFQVGDVMADVCFATSREVAMNPPQLPEVASGRFLLATLHRPYNVDDPRRLRQIIDALASCSVPVLLPAHPRLLARAREQRLNLESGAIVLTKPLSYPELIAAAGSSEGIVTDSGGLQKEAYLLGVPCTTVRSETEWIETLSDGWNVLQFADLASLPHTALRSKPPRPPSNEFGDGHASEAVVDLLLRQ